MRWTRTLVLSGILACTGSAEPEIFERRDADETIRVLIEDGREIRRWVFPRVRLQAGQAPLVLRIRTEDSLVETGEVARLFVEVTNPSATHAAAGVQVRCDLPRRLRDPRVSAPVEHHASERVVVFDPIDRLEPGERVRFVLESTAKGLGFGTVLSRTQVTWAGARTPVEATLETSVL